MKTENDYLHEELSAAQARITELEAELEHLRKDTARLDWLDDVNNTVGQVLLPSAIVETALVGGLRGMIDLAMEMKK